MAAERQIWRQQIRGKQTGRIHSTESFGTVDGPGVRLVIFFQGCPMRCLYCHNPDSWDRKTGTEMSVEDLLEQFERNRPFYRNGGITASGGEPLVQMDFLTALFEEAKRRGIHTCLDTSGIVYREERNPEFKRLFQATDLVLLDIKHSDEEGHQKLTGWGQSPVLAFAKALEQAQVPVIIRHVVVPGITDREEELRKIGHLIGGFRNLAGLEVLPYHTMGINKYKNLGKKYPLEGIPDMKPEKAREARTIILEAIRESRVKALGSA